MKNIYLKNWKAIFLLFAFSFVAASIFAQAPQKMNYQTVVRNSSGILIANANIGVQVTIVQGSPTGGSVYTESHTVTTNANGLATLQVGGGTPTLGTFATINWSSGTFYIKTQIDPTGGTNYTISGTSPLLSVPYALYSGDGNWNKSGADISNSNTGNVGIGTTTPTDKLHIYGNNSQNIMLESPSGGPTVNLVKARTWSGMAAGTYVGFGGTDDGNTSARASIYVPDANNTGVMEAVSVVKGSGNFGLGTTIPAYKLEAIGNQGIVGRFNNTDTNHDYAGVEGSCNNTANYGYGLRGYSGWKGVYGSAALSGNGDRYGVYGYAAGGGGINYGVYCSGDFTCSGTKAATVKTSKGPRELYSQESPDNWFEDFGKAAIHGGICKVSVADDYAEAVTIDAQHPLHAFITPNGNMGNWWIEYKGNSFTVYAPSAVDGTEFDFRMVAKRKGYEDLRMKIVTPSYSDKFLYPNLSDVPSEYQEIWKKANASESKK